jgi:sulfoxide reductase heme-binding subunit YedZ
MTPSQWIRRVGKPLVFAACLFPFAMIVADIFLGRLSANPIEDITHRTGDWILILLLVTLGVTPLRAMTGWGALVQLRRMIGLFAFFYAVLHFSTYVVFDHFFDFAEIVVDITQRPYITVGFTSFVLLIPLAVTSTKGWVKRLGGKRWTKLHRLIYVTAAGGVLHYLWLVKADVRKPTIFGVVLVVLLATRLRLKGRKLGSGRPVRGSAIDDSAGERATAS